MILELALLLSLPAAGAAPSEPGMFYTAGLHKTARLVLASADAQELSVISGHVWAASWSPDGSRILFNASGRDGEPDVVAVTGLDMKPRMIVGQPPDEDFASPVWSSDGRSALVISRQKPSVIVALGIDRKSDAELCPRTTDFIYNEVAPSPDGRKLAVTFRGDGDIFVMGADCSKPVRLKTGAQTVRGVRWSPDGKTLAYVDNPEKFNGENRLVLMDASGANPREFKAGWIGGVSFRDDGRLLMTWSDRKDPAAILCFLGILDPATGEKVVLRQGVNAFYGDAEWRPKKKKGVKKV